MICLTHSLVQEQDFVYYCSYVVFAVLKNSVTWEMHVNAVKKTTEIFGSAELIKLKHYVPDALACPSKDVLEILRTYEGRAFFSA